MVGGDVATSLFDFRTLQKSAGLKRALAGKENFQNPALPFPLISTEVRNAQATA
jgi:hypothetical protein